MSSAAFSVVNQAESSHDGSEDERGQGDSKNGAV
jgi:hypothetical protein